MGIMNTYREILEKLPAHVGVPALLVGNWLFQGFIFAGTEEKVFKVSLELVLILIFFDVFDDVFQFNLILPAAIIIAHSINWLCATNIWSVRIKKSSPTLGHARAVQVLDDLKNKLRSRDYFYGAAVFGSMCTGDFNNMSDIDAKLFRKRGLKNFILSYLFLISIRTEANIKKVPLDVYVENNIENYSLKEGEVPIILFDPDRLLRRFYNKYKIYLCSHAA